MPNFAYEAASANSGLANGVVDAPTRTIAVECILGWGRTPVCVVQQRASNGRSRSDPHALSALIHQALLVVVTFVGVDSGIFAANDMAL